MSSESTIHHLVLLPVPAYGHTRPFCALAARLAAARSSIVITFLMAPNWLQKVRADIAAQFPSGSEAINRIRIVTLFDSRAADIFELIPLTAKHYPAAYETLLQGRAIRCASTGTEFPVVPAPAAVFLDMFAFQQLHATRAQSGTAVPVFSIMASPAAAAIRTFGPEMLGGLGDLGARIDREVARTGRPEEEVGSQIFRQTDGRVVEIPGLPPMYDYESFPQIILDAPIVQYIRGGRELFMQADGVFLASAPAYDGETFAALERWMNKDLKKPIYAVGPLLPFGYGSGQMQVSSTDPREIEIATFLETMRSKYGDKSVLFISFGTVFWPKLHEQVADLIEVLVEEKCPFIICHASPLASVPEGLAEEIKASGLGLATSWAPQQFILNHPATGWFMTHCGHGGIIESLCSGVPMICWPFEADQPVAAAQLTLNLDVAFQLLEVRTGAGLRPLHRGYTPTGTRAAMRAEIRRVLTECRGTVGVAKRENVQKIQGGLAQAWEEGGTARAALQAFFVKFLDAA
ncbi:UDP-Glycosyltransferase/glycogen phosphorylase [Mycena pura]|uniref:UDP-Glycosyltransferase/glycogen phosphorylase n=1 Tax=Mycena pura TaxID=153505 RepID=A0AAD6UY64_9AGAR|nr:UDP-Glycosyltransferase/glycogen phosphorylase [Mycena pura]